MLVKQTIQDIPPKIFLILCLDYEASIKIQKIDFILVR